jgi:uncharacterized membrane protein
MKIILDYIENRIDDLRHFAMIFGSLMCGLIAICGTIAIVVCLDEGKSIATPLLIMSTICSLAVLMTILGFACPTSNEIRLWKLK